MTMTQRTTTRSLGGLGGALLLVSLAACSDSTTSDAGDAVSSATSAAGSGLSEATGSGSPSSAAATDAGSAGASNSSGVDCSGTSCTVTFSGDGTEVNVLGTTVTLGQVQDGQATIGVAGNDLTCSEGETVSAGPLSIECTTISPDNVVLTASLG